VADRDLLLEVRVNMRDARKFQADAAAVTGSIKKMETATHESALASSFANAKSFLWRQTLFTLRRVMYSVTLATSAMVSGAIALGIAYNANLEATTLAFGKLLGSTRMARRELEFLTQLATKTPFSVQNIRSAAQSFLAMGFSVRETNKYLTVLGDVTAALPQLGGEGVQRLAIIFGQIRASGRLLGQDMLQLAQAGIDVRSILQKQLNLSQAQMTQFMQGTLRIPSSVAIPAIMAGLQAKYKGMAEIQSRSFNGMLSNVKDFAAQFMGTMTQGLFNRLEKRLQLLVDLLPKLQAAFKRGGYDELFRTLDKGVGANGRLYEAFRRLRDMAQSLARIWRTALWPALRNVLIVIGVIAKVAVPPLLAALRLLSRHTTLLRIVVELLIARYIYVRTVMVGYVIVTKLATRWTRLWWAANNLLRGSFYLLQKAIEFLKIERFVWQIKLANIWTRAWAAATRLLRSAWIALDVASWANPLGLVVLALIAIDATLITLYFKWRRFHDFVNRHWKLLALLTGPIGELVVLFASMRDILHVLVRLFEKLWGFFRHPLKNLSSVFKGIPGFLLGHAPGAGLVKGAVGLVGRAFAEGGVTSGPTSALVGERGPELLHLPGGARVEPLRGGGGSLDRLPYAIAVAVRRALEDMSVVIDGRQVGKIVVKRVADQAART